MKFFYISRNGAGGGGGVSMPHWALAVVLCESKFTVEFMMWSVSWSSRYQSALLYRGMTTSFFHNKNQA